MDEIKVSQTIAKIKRKETLKNISYRQAGLRISTEEASIWTRDTVIEGRNRKLDQEKNTSLSYISQIASYPALQTK